MNTHLSTYCRIHTVCKDRHLHTSFVLILELLNITAAGQGFIVIVMLLRTNNSSLHLPPHPHTFSIKLPSVKQQVTFSLLNVPQNRGPRDWEVLPKIIWVWTDDLRMPPGREQRGRVSAFSLEGPPLWLQSGLEGPHCYATVNYSPLSTARPDHPYSKQPWGTSIYIRLYTFCSKKYINTCSTASRRHNNHTPVLKC